VLIEDLQALREKSVALPGSLSGSTSIFRIKATETSNSNLHINYFYYHLSLSTTTWKHIIVPTG
jgi:hypothetical protein